MKRVLKGIFLATVLAILMSPIPAEAKNTKLNIKVNPVLKTSLSFTPISIDPDGTLHDSDINISVTSNNKTGFTTTMSTIHDSSEENATALNYEGFDSISSVSNSVTAADFATNAWGYSIDDGATYNQIVAKDAVASEVFATEKASDDGNKVIKIGVKVNDEKSSGRYTNTLLFTTVPNYSPKTLEDIQYMQEVTPEVCGLTPTPSASDGANTPQYWLEDIRDGKFYWVAKLADGNCWMTQNLDYDLSTTTTLTPVDSDVTDNWTPSRATIAGAANISSYTDDNNTPYSFDPGNYYFDGTYFSSAECNYLTTTCDHFATTPYTLNGEHGHIGNYYNWSAAVASNDTSATTAAGTDINTSICPKGWRLPHGYQSTQGNDFETLNTAYGGATNSDSVLLANPLFFVRGGYVYSGSLSNSAYNGYYWSSTAYSAAGADDFYFVSGLVNSSDSRSRNPGFSVRCLARKQTKTLTVKDQSDDSVLATYDFETTYKLPEVQKISYNLLGYTEDPTSTTPTYHVGDTITESKTLYVIYEKVTLYMQDVADWKDKLGLEQQIQVVDIRDNKTYWVAKLADGNIWMTQNLDYDLSVAANQTLTPSTSSVTTTRNVTPVSWGTDPNSIYYLDGGDNYFANGITQTAGLSTLPEDDTNRHYAQGDYYSWKAATAGVGTTSITNADVNESICPSGWRLPTSKSATANYSFGNLVKQYGYSGSNQSASDATLLASPLFFARGGFVDSGSLGNQGSVGDYWSSRADSSSNGVYLLAFNSSSLVYPSHSSIRYRGFSVRCVAL